MQPRRNNTQYFIALSLKWQKRSFPDKGDVHSVCTNFFKHMEVSTLPLQRSSASMVMYHRSVGNHIVRDNYTYTKLCKSDEKSKIKDFNSPRNQPLIFLDYWSNYIKGGFHLCNPYNINISEKSTAQDATNIMNTMVKLFNYTE